MKAPFETSPHVGTMERVHDQKAKYYCLRPNFMSNHGYPAIVFKSCTTRDPYYPRYHSNHLRSFLVKQSIYSHVSLYPTPTATAQMYLRS